MKIRELSIWAAIVMALVTTAGEQRPTDQITFNFSLVENQHEYIESISESLSPFEAAQLEFSWALLRSSVENELHTGELPALTKIAADRIIAFELHGITVQQLIEAPELHADTVTNRLHQHALMAGTRAREESVMTVIRYDPSNNWYFYN